MSVPKKISNFLHRNVSIRRLLMIIMTLVIIYLLTLTSSIWSSIYTTVKGIMLPFVIGFGIAYILHPITKYFERYKIKRQIVVPVTLLVFVFLVILLFSSIVPKLATDITTIINSSVDGIQKLYEMYTEFTNGTPEPWVNDLFNEAVKMMKGLIGSIPTIPTIASQFIGQLIGILTTSLFSLVIGLYCIFDYEDITAKILRGANAISPKLGNSIVVINRAVLQYLQSLIVIMVITFVEYSLLYSVIGHNYALVLGVMASFALLIPYIGPMSIQILGVLTSLTLPPSRVIALTVGLVILSNVDNYVITPMVYSKRDKIDPLSSLFAFFASSALFGFVGILLSMPIYFSIRAVYYLRKDGWKLESEETN
ncbi:AI-2E family transporter [Erysipelothrix sp. HDW6C]|uniref:AI-2E family transporter n=1 Tax=Erysipelothrix sp. HDW6C TaxID=2714930 RepID=UPI0014095979|nr:AI-2E family transporter [Erysipelothrix sp. HDW6C]QIK70212.1 AI-2E family transporter [Erysipelothrix sp. HDW6C]